MGAEITLMSAKLLEEVQEGAKRTNRTLKLQRCELNLQAYSHTGLRLKHMAPIHLIVGSMDLIHTIYVSPLKTYPFLIGKDLLNRFEPLIDFKHVKMWTQIREPLPCQSLDSNESQCQVTDTAPTSRNDDAVSEPRPEPSSSSKDQDPLLCSLQEPESNTGPLRIMTAIDVQGTAHYTLSAAQTTWAGARWTRKVLAHAQADVNHMLHQLQKMTVTQAELSGRHVGEIQAEMLGIRQQLLVQSHALQTFGKSLNGTITILNTHSTLLNQTIKSINKLFSVVQNNVAQTQLLTTLMTDMLREVSSSIDNLAMGRIPHYLIPLSLIQNILTSATVGPSSPIQTHLAFSLGSAITLYVDPEAGDLAFLLSLPIIDSNNIYRLKDIVNVGFWQGYTYIKIHTPEAVAYHDNNEQLYLAPNLKMCTLTKDIHYLCPSKPFVLDNTEGICGLKSIRPDTSCPAEATPSSQVEVTQAEIIGTRWLVNTPARTATLTYDQHDTATRIILPNQTLWITVPKGSILHIDEIALYHLTDDEYQAEISPFFKQHSFVHDPELEERIKEEGTQLID
ncbi:hypothetical protein G5714_018244 [Onychostoma macrolepis]|uniref:Uncharacterized protein n=1 Tax=Onychostoma macrolepis TaxID=369639 RepID=A0A7J6BYI2_9TELE|nr:hypothetical protein G5714_018244 [Onychostoma macrolepis]